MIHIDKEKRSVICPGFFGARISDCESDNSFSPEGIGDAYLISLKRNYFAIADSPEWNFAASREFLLKFNEQVERLFKENSAMGGNGYDIDELKEVLVESTNQLIETIEFLSSTTFTCLFVVPSSSGLRGLALHNGDSCLFKVDLHKNAISQVSNTNMHFIGRSKKLSQARIIEIEEDTRFVLCTDGLQVLSRNRRNTNLEKILLESFTQAEIDRIPDLLIDDYGGNIEFNDDIGVIVLDPNMHNGSKDIFINGGE